MTQLPRDEDESWLFVSEYGTRMDEGRFLKSLKGYLEFGELPKEITLHSIRRYSLNKLAKEAGILVAQYIAGHSEPSTTMLYSQIDADHVRAHHACVAVVQGIVSNPRLE